MKLEKHIVMDVKLEKNQDESVDSDRMYLVKSGGYSVLKFCCTPAVFNAENLPAERLHMTYKTNQAETKLLNFLLNSHGLKEVRVDTNDFNLLWTGLHLKPQLLRNLLPHQRVNHFPRSYELTRKDRLYKNIEQMQYTKGLKHFDFIPQTFILPVESNELLSSQFRHRGAWIVKPVASSRGRGIYIVNSVEDIPLHESLVVAKYIENPLLVNGCKCDLRLYVLVTSYNPLLVYLYEEGLVRFATVKYDYGANNLWNPCMHLCNYSINKHHSDYIKSSDPEADDVGHKWSLSALLKYLKSEKRDVGMLMQRIEDVIIKAILATAPSIVTACKLFVPYHQNCFELYGFDILVDSDLKPWLIEVNLSPSLGCDTILDTRLKSAVLSDLLTLVGLPAIDPVTRPKLLYKRSQSMNRRLKPDGTVRNASATRNVLKIDDSQLNYVTRDEAKLLRMVKGQFERRGGFLRIFPSPDSWKKYSKYLDRLNGTPSFGLPQIGSPVLFHPNYNRLVHWNLFPNSFPQRATPAATSNDDQLLPSIYNKIDRIKYYEQSLSRGYRNLLSNESYEQEALDSSLNSTELSRKRTLVKHEILKCLKNGYQLSKYQEMMIVVEYLQSILSKLKSNGANADVINAPAIIESQCNTILRFLEKMSNHLSEPLQFKMPNQNLKGSGRLAVTAKYLTDFIFIFTKDIAKYKLPSAEFEYNFVPEKIFTHFIQLSWEGDIDEVWNLNTELHKSAPKVAKLSEMNKSASFATLFKSIETIIVAKVSKSLNK